MLFLAEEREENDSDIVHATLSGEGVRYVFFLY